MACVEWPLTSPRVSFQAVAELTEGERAIRRVEPLAKCLNFTPEHSYRLRVRGALAVNRLAVNDF